MSVYEADWFSDEHRAHGGTYGVRGPNGVLVTATGPYKDGWERAQGLAAAMNANDSLSPLASSCQTCGQHSAADDRYHPHLFCVLYLAGISEQEAYLLASGWVRADLDGDA